MASTTTTTTTGAGMRKRARTLRLARGRLNCSSELEAKRNPEQMDKVMNGDLQHDHAPAICCGRPNMRSAGCREVKWGTGAGLDRRGGVGGCWWWWWVV